MVSGTRALPCLSRLWLKLRGEQGSGPEGVDDLCFHTCGGFSPPSPPSPSPPPSNPSLEAQIPVSRPKFQFRGPNPCLEAQILTYAFTDMGNFLLLLLLLLDSPPPISRPKFQFQGPNPSHKAQILATRPKS